MQNPILNKRILLLGYLIIWLIITINHFIFLNQSFNQSIYNSLYDSLVFNAIYFILGISIWYPIRFISVDEKKIWRVFLNHFAGSILTSLIWLAAGYYALKLWFGIDQAYLNFVLDSGVWRFNIGVLFYIVIVSMYYVFIYYNNFKLKLEQEQKLESLVRDAELKSLKYQINPHFIFNSLNSISSLTVSDPKKAREMTIKLSSFLRSTLSLNEQQMVKLGEEIANIKLYLEIEKIRFNERLDFTEEIPKECLTSNIPNMILQPLIENAIKHGVYESNSKININLFCKKENSYLIITVQNNFDPDSVSGKGKGIGLKNVKERLTLIYNQENLLSFNKIDDIFTARIYIPAG